MLSSVYIIRNYRPADFLSFSELVFEAEKREPLGRIFTPELLGEKLNFPGHSPEKDLFVAETEGQIVGYIDVLTELRIERIVLDCFVRHDHRRRTLGAILFGLAIRRGEELGAPIVHVSVLEGNEVGRMVLTRLGFRPVRRFLEMRLILSEAVLEDDGGSVELRFLKQGEEAKLTEVQNRIFAGSWGFQPNTVAEVVSQMRLSRNLPDDIILACEEDKIVGYCWARMVHEASASAKKGQIFMLGVDPQYRGWGMGRRLLLAGLARLKKKGLKAAEIIVDSENRVAFNLYQSLGFKDKNSILWYEKRVP